MRDSAEYLDETVLVGDMDEGRRLCEKGLRLMADGKFEEAVPLFRESTVEAPFVYTAANNLALCLFVTGKLDEALWVQRESLKVAPFPNPLGLANPATFLFISGDEVGGRSSLADALKTEMVSADACVKVCETLARFKCHQAILDIADASGYGKDSSVCFFTGVAAANLGKRQRAEHDLRQVQLGHHKADMTRRYLQNLQERGEIKPNQEAEFYLAGERRKISLKRTRMNPDFRFGNQLPKTRYEVYAKAVKASVKKKKPNWVALGRSFLKVLQEEPDYFPARYNYVVSLLHRNRMKEADVILRELVAEHPEYLFADASLLQVLLNGGRTEEADARLKSTAVPDETHPNAMVACLLAQTLFHEDAERDEAAYQCIKSAHEIAPEHPKVKMIWQD